MDGRESMEISGPSSYYIHHRSISRPTSESPAGLYGTPAIRSAHNSGTTLHVQSLNVGGGGAIGLPFQAESSSLVSQQGGNAGGLAGLGQDASLKKKRGRPRKYGLDGSMSLALSPLSSTSQESKLAMVASPGSVSAAQTQKRGRGRPPGSGPKQQLALLGEWFADSAGMGFTPHVITISIGEDIATKIMSFSQQGPRAICILSANGAVSTVTLRQSATSGGTVTYELLQGRFEILCLSGSYMMTDDGGSRVRSGGLCISLSGPDGRVIGGGVGGSLVAASPVQVIVGSFNHGGPKPKNKMKSDQEPGLKLPESEHPAAASKENTLTSTVPSQSFTSSQMMGGWAGARQAADMRNSHIDIDLMRE